MLSVTQALWVDHASEHWRGVVEDGRLGGDSLESLRAFFLGRYVRKRGREEGRRDVPDMIAPTNFSAIVGLWIWAAIRIPFLRSSARKKSPEPGWMAMVLGVWLVAGGDMVQRFFSALGKKNLDSCGLSGVVTCLNRGLFGVAAEVLVGFL